MVTAHPLQTRDSRDDTFFQQSDIYWEPSHSSAELFDQLAQRKYREIRRSHVRYGTEQNQAAICMSALS